MQMTMCCTSEDSIAEARLNRKMESFSFSRSMAMTMTLQDLIKSQRDIPFKDGKARNNDLGIFPIELFYYHDSNVQKSAES